MDNLNELKTIWQTAKTNELPTSAEMVKMAKKFRYQKLRNKVVSIAVGVGAIVLMLTFLFHKPVLAPTTIAGMVFTLIACVILIYTNARSIKRFIELNDYSNKECIQFLEQTRRNQLHYYKYTQVVGLTFSSIGLLLFLYEFVQKSTTLSAGFYAIAVGWTIFICFYLRPRNFKKRSAKLNDMLTSLKKINDQLQ
jgi:tellurite resistance protein TehA-like permease